MDLKFLLFGFCVHLVFLYSLFDIYFTSPLVHGMKSHKNYFAPPAKRLVLFSADGLRADKLFSTFSGVLRMPFLKHIIENVGTHGISHTRVPTESRPGHVAFIAGFYEDVSAVTRGWKENPVEFDSVFNQSRHTWSWGSPDILPMFSKGATGNHVSTEMYPGHSEDFAGTDLTMLDTWVFDRVQSFFNKSKHHGNLLEKDGLIFFLHLLGLDTMGHIHKPHSQEYVRSLKVVDEGIQKVVKIIEEYFGHDGLTSFIFTSDHGMTDWGSHGAGDPSETQTPFVAWGAGINGPVFDDAVKSLKRYDINQADICPLMATLIGIPIPHHSVGVIPVDMLNISMGLKAQSLYTNVLQVYEQYKIKEKEKQDTIFSTFFSQYKADTQLKERITLVETFIEKKNFQNAVNECTSLICAILQGVQYYHHYDVNFLGLCVATSFLGWMLLTIVLMLEEHSNIPHSPLHLDSSWKNCIGVVLTFLGAFVPILVFMVLTVQSKPIMHYLYCLLPVFICHAILRRHWVVWAALMYLRDNALKKSTFLCVVLGAVSLEVAIFSFTHRQMISVGLVAIAAWKLLDRSGTWIAWVVFCLVASIFPLLPTVGLASNYVLVYSSAVLGFFLYMFSALKIHRNSIKSNESERDLLLHTLQIFLMFISCFIVWWFATHRKMNSTSSLAFYLHSFSWLILIFSFVVPLMSSTKMLPRLLSIFLAFFCPYLLLSISHEALFYLNLCALMMSWILLETGLSFEQLLQTDFKKHKFIQRKLRLSDMRCSYFFIFFLLTSFFGTGNIASINSFDPTSVLCFVTIFNPFVMGGLMLFKIVILFLVVSSSFYAIQVAMNVPKNGFFFLVLIISDFMALHFFFLVKNQGSWLEIGVSISHYVIVMTLILSLFILLSICEAITETTIIITCWSNKQRRE